MKPVFARTLVAALALFLLSTSNVFAVATYATGMVVPETISPIPAGSGYGPGFLVPDPSAQTVWNIPAGGGIAQPFASANLQSFDSRPGTERVLGGMFLPSDWLGPGTGTPFITTGYFLFSDATGGSQGLIWKYDTAGSRTLFSQDSSLSLLTTPAIAPAGFGSTANKLVVTDQNGFVFAIDSSGVATKLYDHNAPGISNTSLDFNPFGLVFAPSAFGSVGGRLLLGENNDARHPGTVNIYSLTSSSSVPSLFATIPLLPDQRGLRQMAFESGAFLGPNFPGVDPSEQLLFVSMSGSAQGGGTQGDILALDQDGNVVASLRTVDELTKFDPRGLLFQGNQLLVSDASDPIIVATGADFLPGRFGNLPEPSGPLSLVVVGLAVLGATRRAR